MVRNSTIVDNAGGGILASGEPTLVYLSQVTTTENAAFGDLSAASGATITSFGNNSIPFSTPTNVIALK